MINFTFNQTTFNVIHRNQEVWFQMSDIAEALGYSEIEPLNKIYNKNLNKFNDLMTIKLDKEQISDAPIRLFSLHGGHLLTLFVRSAIAKEFRKWILDILSHERSLNLTISLEQHTLLHEIIIARTKGNLDEINKVISSLNNQYKISKSDELLTKNFYEACHYLCCFPIETRSEENENYPMVLEALAQETTHKVMDYYWALHAEIKKLGGKSPDSPQFDKETIVRASVTRMIDSSRMLLTFNCKGQPSIKFIPQDSWIISEDNIVNIIADREGVSKKMLPDIVQAAIKRIIF